MTSTMQATSMGDKLVQPPYLPLIPYDPTHRFHDNTSPYWLEGFSHDKRTWKSRCWQRRYLTDRQPFSTRDSDERTTIQDNLIVLFACLHYYVHFADIENYYWIVSDALGWTRKENSYAEVLASVFIEARLAYLHFNDKPAYSRYVRPSASDKEVLICKLVDDFRFAPFRQFPVTEQRANYINSLRRSWEYMITMTPKELWRRPPCRVRCDEEDMDWVVLGQTGEQQDTNQCAGPQIPTGHVGLRTDLRIPADVDWDENDPMSRLQLCLTEFSAEDVSCLVRFMGSHDIFGCEDNQKAFLDEVRRMTTAYFWLAEWLNRIFIYQATTQAERRTLVLIQSAMILLTEEAYQNIIGRVDGLSRCVTNLLNGLDRFWAMLEEEVSEERQPHTWSSMAAWVNRDW